MNDAEKKDFLKRMGLATTRSIPTVTPKKTYGNYRPTTEDIQDIKKLAANFKVELPAATPNATLEIGSKVEDLKQ